ncbi:hypothetical protein F5Y07DRAFT_394080 [Xylaria sp. FL0933]|nr:hypothetical protein F5Y07DRAFT_394080 [Xylaria sp. FL0933]
MSDLDFSPLSMDDLLEALKEPALSPPEGVNPYFEHPPNLRVGMKSDFWRPESPIWWESAYKVLW